MKANTLKAIVVVTEQKIRPKKKKKNHLHRKENLKNFSSIMDFGTMKIFKEQHLEKKRRIIKIESLMDIEISNETAS